MIEARHFVEAARERGFEWYAGVPCSYLTPFINYVLQDPSLHYVSMANEGDAVALIAGVALGGTAQGGHRRGISMMQNSGLGNAVSPLTSLTWTFRLPQLLIVTWRGQPGVHDEPQHQLMGPITPTMLDTMEIRWELFPTEPEAIGLALGRAVEHMDTTGRPYALVMQKGSVSSYALKPGADAIAVRSARASVTVSSNHVPPAARVTRQGALREVVARTSPATTVVLASTGFCGRELYAIDDRPNQLYMVGSMGCIVPLALGLALARPDLRVIALDGDGAALMRLGAFATVGAYGPPNLWHLLLDNGVHDSTGAQATVSPNVSFAEVAAACGYTTALDTDTLGRISEWLESPRLDGPRFARLLTRPGSPADLPRPTITPVDVKSRLMQHFGPLAVTERDRAASEGIPSAGDRAASEEIPSGESVLMLLLNPGPVTLSERVRRSLLQPDLCHRESEFFDLQDEARARLLAVYGLSPAQWTAVLMTGSGTAAVESMMASLVPEGGRVLVVENGVYGERIAQMCAQYRIPHERLTGAWMEAPSLEVVEARLDAAGDVPFTHLAVIHHETTTGRLNDLQALADLCRRRDLQLLVDGVSSFGAEELDFSASRLAAVAATANKCLHGVPGVSFVMVRRDALARAASRTYYLDLGRLAKLQDQRNTPFTPAVHAYYALVEALRELEEQGGRPARYRHYSALAEQVRAGLEALGIQAAIAPGESSVVLRAYRLPTGLTYTKLHDQLKAGGFVIYAGQGDLSKTLFRISTMGHLSRADIDRLLTCFAKLR